MDEKIAEEFVQKGCKCRKSVAIAVQVYLELCEVKRYWDVQYYYNNALERIYFTARKKRNENPSIFVPVPVVESLSFMNLQNLCKLSDDLDNQTIYVVIVNSDANCVYYQVTNGLAEPLISKTSREDQSHKLDKNLNKNRKLLEEAALYGIPITLPKKQNNEVGGTSTSQHDDDENH